MTTTLITNGTIVTADRSYEAEVLIADGTIQRIGRDLGEADETIDAHGCYVMPGGIDPHTHMEMPFMGTFSSDDFETGHPRRAVGRHDHGGRLLPPRARPVAPGGAARLEPEGRQGDDRLLVPHGHHLVGRAGVEGDGDGRRSGHQHLQALHGLQGRADGERRRDVPVVPQMRGTGRHPARPRRERRRRRAAPGQADGGGKPRAGGARLLAPAGRGGRGRQPRHHDRRPGRRAALRRPRLLRGGARGDPPGAPIRQAGLGRAADPAPRARRERSTSTRTGCTPRGA